MFIVCLLEFIFAYLISTIMRNNKSIVLSSFVVFINIIMFFILQIFPMFVDQICFWGVNYFFDVNLLQRVFDTKNIADFNVIFILIYLFALISLLRKKNDNFKASIVIKVAFWGKLLFLSKSLILFILLMEILKYYFYLSVTKDNKENKTIIKTFYFFSTFSSFLMFCFILKSLHNLSPENAIFISISDLSYNTIYFYPAFIFYLIVNVGFIPILNQFDALFCDSDSHVFIYFTSFILPVSRILFSLNLNSLVKNQSWYYILGLFGALLLRQIYSFYTRKDIKLKTFELFKLYYLLITCSGFFFEPNRLIFSMLISLFISFVLISYFQNMKIHEIGKTAKVNLYPFFLLIVILNAVWFPGSFNFWFFVKLLSNLYVQNIEIFVSFLVIHLAIVYISIIFVVDIFKQTQFGHKKISIIDYSIFVTILFTNFLILGTQNG